MVIKTRRIMASVLALCAIAATVHGAPSPPPPMGCDGFDSRSSCAAWNGTGGAVPGGHACVHVTAGAGPLAVTACDAALEALFIDGPTTSAVTIAEACAVRAVYVVSAVTIELSVDVQHAARSHVALCGDVAGAVHVSMKHRGQVGVLSLMGAFGPGSNVTSTGVDKVSVGPSAEFEGSATFAGPVRTFNASAVPHLGGSWAFLETSQWSALDVVVPRVGFQNATLSIARFDGNVSFVLRNSSVAIARTTSDPSIELSLHNSTVTIGKGATLSSLKIHQLNNGSYLLCDQATIGDMVLNLPGPVRQDDRAVESRVLFERVVFTTSKVSNRRITGDLTNVVVRFFSGTFGSRQLENPFFVEHTQGGRIVFDRASVAFPDRPDPLGDDVRSFVVDNIRGTSIWFEASITMTTVAAPAPSPLMPIRFTNILDGADVSMLILVWVLADTGRDTAVVLIENVDSGATVKARFNTARSANAHLVEVRSLNGTGSVDLELGCESLKRAPAEFSDIHAFRLLRIQYDAYCKQLPLVLGGIGLATAPKPAGTLELSGHIGVLSVTATSVAHVLLRDMVLSGASAALDVERFETVRAEGLRAESEVTVARVVDGGSVTLDRITAPGLRVLQATDVEAVSVLNSDVHGNAEPVSLLGVVSESPVMLRVAGCRVTDSRSKYVLWVERVTAPRSTVLIENNTLTTSPEVFSVSSTTGIMVGRDWSVFVFPPQYRPPAERATLIVRDNRIMVQHVATLGSSGRARAGGVVVRGAECHDVALVRNAVNFSSEFPAVSGSSVAVVGMAAYGGHVSLVENQFRLGTSPTAAHASAFVDLDHTACDAITLYSARNGFGPLMNGSSYLPLVKVSFIAVPMSATCAMRTVEDRFVRGSGAGSAALVVKVTNGTHAAGAVRVRGSTVAFANDTTSARAVSAVDLPSAVFVPTNTCVFGDLCGGAAASIANCSAGSSAAPECRCRCANGGFTTEAPPLQCGLYDGTVATAECANATEIPSENDSSSSAVTFGSSGSGLAVASEANAPLGCDGFDSRSSCAAWNGTGGTVPGGHACVHVTAGPGPLAVTACDAALEALFIDGPTTSAVTIAEACAVRAVYVVSAVTIELSVDVQHAARSHVALCGDVAGAVHVSMKHRGQVGVLSLMGAFGPGSNLTSTGVDKVSVGPSAEFEGSATFAGPVRTFNASAVPHLGGSWAFLETSQWSALDVVVPRVGFQNATLSIARFDGNVSFVLRNSSVAIARTTSDPSIELSLHNSTVTIGKEATLSSLKIHQLNNGSYLLCDQPRIGDMVLNLPGPVRQDDRAVESRVLFERVVFTSKVSNRRITGDLTNVVVRFFSGSFGSRQLENPFFVEHTQGGRIVFDRASVAFPDRPDPLGDDVRSFVVDNIRGTSIWLEASITMTTVAAPAPSPLMPIRFTNILDGADVSMLILVWVLADTSRDTAVVLIQNVDSGATVKARFNTARSANAHLVEVRSLNGTGTVDLELGCESLKRAPAEFSDIHAFRLLRIQYDAYCKQLPLVLGGIGLATAPKPAGTLELSGHIGVLSVTATSVAHVLLRDMVLSGASAALDVERFETVQAEGLRAQSVVTVARVVDGGSVTLDRITAPGLRVLQATDVEAVSVLNSDVHGNAEPVSLLGVVSESPVMLRVAGCRVTDSRSKYVIWVERVTAPRSTVLIENNTLTTSPEVFSVSSTTGIMVGRDWSVFVFPPQYRPPAERATLIVRDNRITVHHFASAGNPWTRNPPGGVVVRGAECHDVALVRNAVNFSSAFPAVSGSSVAVVGMAAYGGHVSLVENQFRLGTSPTAAHASAFVDLDHTACDAMTLYSARNGFGPLMNGSSYLPLVKVSFIAVPMSATCAMRTVEDRFVRGSGAGSAALVVKVTNGTHAAGAVRVRGSTVAFANDTTSARAVSSVDVPSAVFVPTNTCVFGDLCGGAAASMANCSAGSSAAPECRCRCANGGFTTEAPPLQCGLYDGTVATAECANATEIPPETESSSSAVTFGSSGSGSAVASEANSAVGCDGFDSRSSCAAWNGTGGTVPGGHACVHVTAGAGPLAVTACDAALEALFIDGPTTSAVTIAEACAVRAVCVVSAVTIELSVDVQHAARSHVALCGDVAGAVHVSMKHRGQVGVLSLMGAFGPGSNVTSTGVDKVSVGPSAEFEGSATFAGPVRTFNASAVPHLGGSWAFLETSQWSALDVVVPRVGFQNATLSIARFDGNVSFVLQNSSVAIARTTSDPSIELSLHNSTVTIGKEATLSSLKIHQLNNGSYLLCDQATIGDMVLNLPGPVRQDDRAVESRVLFERVVFTTSKVSNRRITGDLTNVVVRFFSGSFGSRQLENPFFVEHTQGGRIVFDRASVAFPDRPDPLGDDVRSFVVDNIRGTSISLEASITMTTVAAPAPSPLMPIRFTNILDGADVSMLILVWVLADTSRDTAVVLIENVDSEATVKARFNTARSANAHLVEVRSLNGTGTVDLELGCESLKRAPAEFSDIHAFRLLRIQYDAYCKQLPLVLGGIGLATAPKPAGTLELSGHVGVLSVTATSVAHVLLRDMVLSGALAALDVERFETVQAEGLRAQSEVTVARVVHGGSVTLDRITAPGLRVLQATDVEAVSVLNSDVHGNAEPVSLLGVVSGSPVTLRVAGCRVTDSRSKYVLWVERVTAPRSTVLIENNTLTTSPEVFSVSSTTGIMVGRDWSVFVFPPQYRPPAERATLIVRDNRIMVQHVATLGSSGRARAGGVVVRGAECHDVALVRNAVNFSSAFPAVSGSSVAVVGMAAYGGHVSLVENQFRLGTSPTAAHASAFVDLDHTACDAMTLYSARNGFGPLMNGSSYLPLVKVSFIAVPLSATCAMRTVEDRFVRGSGAGSAALVVKVTNGTHAAGAVRVRGSTVAFANDTTSARAVSSVDVPSAVFVPTNTCVFGDLCGGAAVTMANCSAGSSAAPECRCRCANGGFTTEAPPLQCGLYDGTVATAACANATEPGTPITNSSSGSSIPLPASPSPAKNGISGSASSDDTGDDAKNAKGALFDDSSSSHLALAVALAAAVITYAL